MRCAWWSKSAWMNQRAGITAFTVGGWCSCSHRRPQPNFYGFAPRPVPKLIATYKTHGPTLPILRGIDRDRAVDESGNQLAAFGRRGSRPFNQEEMKKLYMRNGQLFTVDDTPVGSPVDLLKSEKRKESTSGTPSPER